LIIVKVTLRAQESHTVLIKLKLKQVHDFCGAPLHNQYSTRQPVGG